MDTRKLKLLIDQLNYKWFSEKQELFQNEGLYDKCLGKIYDQISLADNDEVEFQAIDIDLKQYCWNNIFDQQDQKGPINSCEISYGILQFAHTYTTNFTDPRAIDIVISQVVLTIQNQIQELQKDTRDESFSEVLEDFVKRTRTLLEDEFSYIRQQIELVKDLGGIERKLTVELCEKIANFRIDNKKLVTSVQGDLTLGQALHYVLTDSDKRNNIKISIEDWPNKDVYYLLYSLSNVVTSKFSIANIERKRAIYLKTAKLFERKMFDNFKSQKLDAYKSSSTSKSVIDKDIASLFQV